MGMGTGFSALLTVTLLTASCGESNSLEGRLLDLETGSFRDAKAHDLDASSSRDAEPRDLDASSSPEDSNDAETVAPCAPGFVAMQGGCVDIDECRGAGAPCGPFAECVNRPGSFSCVCAPGLGASCQRQRPPLGLIRWDMYSGHPFVTKRQEYEFLDKPEYRWRAPFYFGIDAQGGLSFNDEWVTGEVPPASARARIAQVTEAEIGYAAAAGIDYWAFGFADIRSDQQSGIGISYSLEAYLASPNRHLINFTLIITGGRVGVPRSLKVDPQVVTSAWSLLVAQVVDMVKEPSWQRVPVADAFGRPRPLLFFYAPESLGANLVAGTARSWLTAVRESVVGLRDAIRNAGLGELYLVATPSFQGSCDTRDSAKTAPCADLLAAGFDAVTPYHYRQPRRPYPLKDYPDPTRPYHYPYSDLWPAIAEDYLARVALANPAMKIVVPMMSGANWEPRSFQGLPPRFVEDGSCLLACPFGEACLAGRCVSCVDAGLVDCGGLCRDKATDWSNCGGCNMPCAPGQICRSGACANFAPVFSYRYLFEEPTASELRSHVSSGLDYVVEHASQVEARTALMYAWNEHSEGGFVNPILNDTWRLDELSRALKNWTAPAARATNGPLVANYSFGDRAFTLESIDEQASSVASALTVPGDSKPEPSNNPMTGTAGYALRCGPGVIQLRVESFAVAGLVLGRLTLAVRRDNPAAPDTLLIEMAPDTAPFMRVAELAIGGTGEWEQLSIAIPEPLRLVAETTRLRISLRASGGWGANGGNYPTLLLDDLTLSGTW